MSDAAPAERGPYVGLIPYKEEDARYFFGREREQHIITSNLMGSRLTLLYGPTGSGKTSVLRAGVAHHLNLLAKENRGKFGRPELAVLVFRKWQGGDPLPKLQEGIKKSVGRALGDDARLDELPADDLARTLARCSKLIAGDVLIILDQFEEYFLYHGRGGETNFSKQIAEAVNLDTSHASFLISIREDALAKLDHFKGKIPHLFNNYLRIQHLTSEAARDAIKKPLKVYSELTPDMPPYEIEEQLVDEVCKQVQVKRGDLILDSRRGAPEEAAGTTHVETSYLQLVMDRLWKHEHRSRSRVLSLATLKHLGGAANIVQDHLGVNITGFAEDVQEAAAAIFRYLVTPSGTKIAYTASDLAELTELPVERVESVLEKMCGSDTRILRSFYTGKSGSGVKNYEIYHDVLANAILDWRAWYLRDQARIEGERRAREEQERERERQREAEEARRKREEAQALRERLRARRRTKRLLLTLMLSTVVTLVFAILYLYAKGQQRMAQAAAREAEKQRAEAQKVLAVVDASDRSVGNFKAIMRGHLEPVLGVDINRDGTRVVTASADNTARIWDAATGKTVIELKGHTAAVRSAYFSPDGSRVATASNDHTARLWDAGTGRELHLLQGHTKEVSAARFSADGRLLVTASDDGMARVWDTGSGQQVLAALSAHSGPVTYAAFSSDNASVVTAGTDGTAKVWNLASNNYQNLEGHVNEVNMASFSPDRELVVTASTDWTTRLWRVSDGQSYKLEGHAGPVNTAAFSTDGALVVTASDDKTARVWDVKTRATLVELKGHTDAVVGAMFSDDGARVITASADKTARVWETSSGRVLFELRGHTEAINQAVLSTGGGKVAATASADKTARLWDIGGEGGLRITDVAVEAEPDNYSGPCPAPVRVKISARITATGSGTITYRFVRSDGFTGKEQTLRFETSGTKEVSTTWLFGNRVYPNSAGTIQLEITPKPSMTIKGAPYSIKCIFPTAGTQASPTPAPGPPAVPTPVLTPPPASGGGPR